MAHPPRAKIPFPLKIPVFILSAALGLAILLEGWTLTQIIDLKVAVAAINTQLNQRPIAKINE